MDRIIPEADRRRIDEEDEQRQLEADLVFEPRKRKAVVKYHEEVKEDSEADKKKKVTKPTPKPSNTGSPALQEGFSEKEIRGVHRGLMKFGTSPGRLDMVIQEAGTKRGKPKLPFFSLFLNESKQTPTILPQTKRTFKI